MLKNVLVKTWQVGEDPTWVIDELESIADKGENYQRETEHGVQQLILNGVMDSYTILYRDGQMVVGSGTRPEVNVPELGMCYQMCVRSFRIPQQGLRQDYFGLDMLIPEQLARGKKLGYDKCIITFNLYNERLMRNLDRHWDFPRQTVGPYVVNGVQQWIYLF